MALGFDALDAWRESVDPYTGSNTETALAYFLDHEVASDYRAPLEATNPASHLYDCWVLWQSPHGGSTPAFAGRWRNIYRLAHIVRILRADDLLAAVESSIAELETIPREVLELYDETTGLFDERRNGSVDAAVAERLDYLLESRYFELWSTSCRGAEIAPPVGDGYTPLSNALASYLEAIRTGAPVTLAPPGALELVSLRAEFPEYSETSG